jgi:beta-catenin-like protein 1
MMNGHAASHPKDEDGDWNARQEDEESTLRPAKKTKSVTIAEERNEEHPSPFPDNVLKDTTKTQKVVSLTAAGVRSAVLSLRKAIQVNAQQRAKNEADAAAYMESEVDLYEEIVQLKALAADPSLYAIVLQDGAVADLLQLLLHENVDIATSVVSVFVEWLDVDLFLEVQEQDNHIRDMVIQMATTFLIDGAEACWNNLERTSNEGQNYDDDTVGRGQEQLLSAFIQLMEMDLEGALQQSPQMNGCSVAKWLCQNTPIISWIFTEWTVSTSPSEDTDSHQQRLLELLAYITPREDVYTIPTLDWANIPRYCTPSTSATTTSTKDNNSHQLATSIHAMELLLQSVGAFRKRQPATEAELERLENCCTIVASLLTFSPDAITAFLEAQGIELVLRCCKERVYAGALSLSWLDFATGSDAVLRRACEYAVEVGALKYIFPLFMGRQLPKYHQINASESKHTRRKLEFQASIEAATIRFLYGLTRHLRDDSPHDAKARVLAKFLGNNQPHAVETPNEKICRLVDRLLFYDQKARLAEYNFYRSDIEETLNDPSLITLAALETKLAGGGDLLHRLAAIAAFVCCGSQQGHAQVLAKLKEHQSGISLIREALEEFVSVLEKSSEQRRHLQGYLDQI